MPLVAYEPLENGLTRFSDGNGRSLTAFGPEAERMRRQIDSMPDRRMASAEPVMSSMPEMGPPAPPPSRADVGPQMSMAPPPAPAASVAPAPPPRPADPPSSSGAVPGETFNREGVTGGPPVTPGLATAAGLMDTERRKVWSPGRAEVSPETEAQRFMARGGRTVEGPDLTPEEKAEYLQRLKDDRVAIDAGLEEHRAASAERIAAAEQRKTDALNATIGADIERSEAQKRATHVQHVWDTTNAELQRELDNVTQMKVDPNRLFSQKSTAAQIGTALAVGLGAFGAALTGGKNYAHDIVQTAIDRDINAQVDEIHRKGQNAQNAVANFQRQYGMTLDEARVSAKTAALNYAAARAEMTAASIGAPEARAQAAAQAIQMRQQAAQNMAVIENSVRGRAAQNYVPVTPQAAVAGRLVDESDEAYNKRIRDRAATTKAVAEAGGAVNEVAGINEKPEEANARLKRETFDLERRVTLPDGSFAYSTSKELADKARSITRSSEAIKANYEEMRAIMSHAGSSMDPQSIARWKALVADTKVQFKNLHELGAITESDSKIIDPMTAEQGNDVASLKSTTDALIKQSGQAVERADRFASRDLFKDSSAQIPLKKAEKAIGIEETHE